MSIFNQRLNKILNEWTEAGIDHHMDRGVDLESYREMMDRINEHYQVEITRLRGLVKQYLQHVGHQLGDDNRRPEEQKALLSFQQLGMVLNRLSASLRKSNTGMQTVERANVAPLLLKRAIHWVRNATLQTYRGLQKFQQDLAALNLHPDPTIFRDIGGLVSELDAELRKVHDYFSQHVEQAGAGSYWDMPRTLDQDDDQDEHVPLPADIDEMLETPESQWMPMLSPTDLQQVVLDHPEHGAREALAKISTIVNYGPDRNDAGEELHMIVEAWGLTRADIQLPTDWPAETLAGLQEWLDSDEPAKYGL